MEIGLLAHAITLVEGDVVKIVANLISSLGVSPHIY